jgi:hypothetical protein
MKLEKIDFLLKQNVVLISQDFQECIAELINLTKKNKSANTVPEIDGVTP